MTRIVRIAVALICHACCFGLNAQTPTQAPTQTPQQTQPPPTTWPKVFFRNNVTNTIYQPQLDSWDGNTLKATSAVSIQPANSKQSVFGTITFTANTIVDKAERIVHLENLQITNPQFPSTPDRAERYAQMLRSDLPKQVRDISLDRLESSMAILGGQTKTSNQPLRNDAPKIIFSTIPAMLVQVDGDPVFRPVEGTDLERVFNTRALIVRDKSGKVYMHFFNGYVEASSLDGPWNVSLIHPPGLDKVEQQAVAAKQVDLLAGQPNPETGQKPSLDATPIPKIIVSTTPTELIVTTGTPQWVPIPTTQLLCATNTDAHLFKSLVDQKTYVLISGRWFSSPGFEGPWQYVPGNTLPKDFASIPDASSEENVKAAVPGTRQAQEASIANSIPQTVKVDRNTQKMDPPPQFDGDPKLAPIEGTSLQYVVNSALPVIKVDDKTWYSVQNGVWFVAASPNGPWAVADKVPAVIYSIPPSSPLYYVTNVKVYNSDPQYVWVGATPGYYGTAVQPDGVVVYGTGYNYVPYIGNTVFVAYPVTYGYGSNPCWTPWAGWAFGFAAGWDVGGNWNNWCFAPPAPYWGPYSTWCYGRRYNAYGGITSWGPYGWAGTSGYVYHNAGAWNGVTRGAAGYDAWTGNEWASRYGRSYNSVTGTRTAGYQRSVGNVYTGNYAYGGRGAAYNTPTGISATGSRVTAGNAASGQSVTAGRGTVYNPNTGRASSVAGVQGAQGGAVDINGHAVASHDGNVYYGQNGTWNQANRNYEAQANTARAEQTQAFNNEVAARQTGAAREASFQNTRPEFHGGGGGFRGGRR
jgi:hypothetical protein